MKPLRWSIGLTLLAVACARSPLPPDISFPVGAFTLTRNDGESVSADDLKGHVWLASFVFTRCTGPCPQVTATVARLQSELTDPRLRFVTFTVDPERDNPAELRQYAAHFQADPERWWFLTGSEAEIHGLLRERFKVAVERADGTPEPGQEFDHSTKLVLVDQDGLIRGYFDGMSASDGPDPAFEQNLDRLRQRVRQLLDR
jgi:cytochrome oxidase Cu insertion factor (SCO1/SenC/PrrC family)